MGLKGEDALVQVKNTDGNNTWNELGEAHDVTVTVEPNLLDDTSFGDSADDQIKGLINGSIEIAIRQSSSPSTAAGDVRDAATDANATNENLQVEFAPNGQAGGTITVVAFTAMPSSLEMTAASDDNQEENYSLEVSDGSKPTISQTTLS